MQTKSPTTGIFCETSALILSTIMFGAVGCAPEQQYLEPVVLQPTPRLAAATDQQITLFGELPDSQMMGFESRQATSVRRHTFAEEGADFDPNIDAKGERMVFASTRHSHMPDLYIKSVDGRAVTQLVADPSSDVQPALSPDGSRVAFASNRSGNWDIWVIDIDGTNLIQISSTPSHDVSPSWAPDGRSLAYCSSAPDGGQWEMWISDVIAGGTRRFIGYGLFPEWSPVGNSILYQQARERGSRWFSIWTLELIDDEPRFPTEIAFSAEQALILPTWSPDATQIAYCAVTATTPGADEYLDLSASAEIADLWIINIDGTNKTRLTGGNTPSFSPVWSTQGRIYYTGNREGKENIWSLMPTTRSTGSVVSRPDSQTESTQFQAVRSTAKPQGS